MESKGLGIKNYTILLLVTLGPFEQVDMHLVYGGRDQCHNRGHE